MNDFDDHNDDLDSHTIDFCDHINYFTSELDDHNDDFDDHDDPDYIDYSLPFPALEASCVEEQLSTRGKRRLYWGLLEQF